jgi:hypothetical protein
MTEPHEVPNIFSSTGTLAPLSKEQFAAMTDDQRALYVVVSDAALICQEQEAAVLDLTSRLHAAVRSLREIEQRLVNLPRPSRIDLCRMLAAQK